MKKRKRSLKGMTLFEIIISIAIFAVMGSLLILVGRHIDRTTRAANVLKQKVVEESPYAANHVKSKGLDAMGNTIPLATDVIDIKISMEEQGTYYVTEPVDPANPAAGFNVVQKNYNKPNVEMKADKYKTEEIMLEGKGSKEQEFIQNGPNNGLNLDFFEVQPTTTAPVVP